jgi:hypothetical protein
VFPALFCALTSAADAADPVLGVDWVPFGRADLVWVDEGRSSGTGVGEFDGLLRPALTFYGGLDLGQNVLILGLGVALERTTTWTAESRSTVSAGGIRPSVDIQRLWGPQQDRVHPWFGGGFYGIWPVARDVSTANSQEQADAASDNATSTRFRIAGAGLRAGLGADFDIADGFQLGFRAHLVGHNGWRYTVDEFSWSTLVYGEAAVRVQVWWQ